MKKGKSLKIKIITLMISCLLFCIITIGGVGLISIQRANDSDSAKIMNLLSKNKADEIDAVLMRIEQSVNTLSSYTKNHIDINSLRDENYVKNISDALIDIAINEATNTKGAEAVYVRFNPKLSTSTAGFFYSRDQKDRTFKENKTTDLSLYDENDDEYVNWFYIPMHNRKSTWTNVYYKRNIQLEIISYVVPIFEGDTFVGVVGMDINFSILKNVIKETKFYDSGYAFLTDNKAKIIYHNELKAGTSLYTYSNGEMKDLAQNLSTEKSSTSLYDYTYNAQPKKLAYHSLLNHMRLIVTAPTSEINAQFQYFVVQTGIIALVIVLLSILITIWFVRKLIKPLAELNEAAQKIAKMDLSITIEHQSNDEVGMLANSFRMTVNHLQTYMDYINSLAYRDSLTGVKNKTSYVDAISNLDASMKIEILRFAMIVFDINGLKRVNDTYGHDSGDHLIIQSCLLICNVFDNNSVYRIGGDEFVVILEDLQYNQRDQLIKDFYDEMRHYNVSEATDEQISIADGMAVYDSQIDIKAQDVFKRADSAMYHRKIDMKK